MAAIEVIHHQEPDGWWAEAPDVPGWSAAAASQLELVKLAEEGLREFLGEDVELHHVMLTEVVGRAGGTTPVIFFDHVNGRVVISAGDPSGGREELRSVLDAQQELEFAAGGVPPG